jgi:hypothetical protein
MFVTGNGNFYIHLKKPQQDAVETNASEEHTVFIARSEDIASSFTTEDGGSMFLRNAGLYLEVRMALQPRRPTSTCSPLWKPDTFCI